MVETIVVVTPSSIVVTIVEATVVGEVTGVVTVCVRTEGSRMVDTIVVVTPSSIVVTIVEPREGTFVVTVFVRVIGSLGIVVVTIVDDTIVEGGTVIVIVLGGKVA